MQSLLKLEIVQGPLAGTKYEFAEHTACIVGRANDCHIQLPPESARAGVSRHHCIFDINPPDIRICDFESLNGTFVNGKRVDAQKQRNPAVAGAKNYHVLKHGDEVGIGDSTIRVYMMVQARCKSCGKNIPELGLVPAPDATKAPCKGCSTAGMHSGVAGHSLTSCIKCGQAVRGASHLSRRSETLCPACQNNSAELAGVVLSFLTKKPTSGHQSWTIERELGRGGTSAVLLVREKKCDSAYALKVMHPRLAADEESKDRFLREIFYSRQLKHPYFVPIYDYGWAEDVFFFTMEYCSRGTLSSLLAQRGGRIPIPEAGEIILHVLDGLSFAHSAVVRAPMMDGTEKTVCGLVHRDLKPSNILIAEENGAPVFRIGDFGLGKAFETAGLSDYTRTGTFSGTLAYMPRQQVYNFKYSGPELDVWAAAAIFYRMITGYYPRNFPDKDRWRAVLNTSPIPIRERDIAVPARLAEVIDRALEDEDSLHFNTADQFKKAIMRVLPR